MKRIFILINVLLIPLGIGMTACEEYLDRSPEADISEEQVFSNFQSFQGFVEELYSCMPDMSKPTWTGEWNWADETLSTTSGSFRLDNQFDLGNYWAWKSGGVGWDNSWLDDTGANTTPGEAHNKGLWPLSWYGIRKANIGLANIDRLVDATQEEKDVVRGQLLFFRAFFHFQLMSFWGGIPYIDKALTGGDKLDLPRLTYREAALKVAADLEEAANYLPADWDKTQVGQATLNNNNQRITKSAAYGYLGKNLLYAASPLMNKVSTGSVSYDAELCKSAADAFVKMLKLSDSGEADYQLLPLARYHENFYTISSYGKVPGYPEVIVGPPCYTPWKSRWGLAGQYVPPMLGGDAVCMSPTANYVNNFGMANGLPITEEDSGYDIADPWSNRDPRFYQQIVVDGDRMIQGSGGSEIYRFAQLYNGGNIRSDANASRSGYLYRKFTGPGSNNVDNEWNQINIIIPYLRLADVYLMYAEAVLHGYGTPQSSHGGYITAVDAVNIVRARANVSGVDARFLSNKDAFMKELIRERAVELGCEGLRFHDLRRWLLAGEKEYKEKKVVDFDRGPNGKPINYRERVAVTRVFEEKHYWLPLPVDQVNLYESFGQNPGW